MDLIGNCEVVDGVVQRGLRALRQAVIQIIMIFTFWLTMMIMLLMVMRTIIPYGRADDWGRGLCWDGKGRSHWRPWSGQGIEIVVIVKWQYSIHHGWITIVISIWIITITVIIAICITIGVANVVVTYRMELGRGEVAVSEVAVAVIEVCAFIMTIEIMVTLSY